MMAKLKLLWRIYRIIASLVVLAVAAAFGFVALKLFFMDDSTIRSDIPIASPSPSIPHSNGLPKSATDIYYMEHVGGLQSLESFMRFKVPTSEVDFAVDGLISENNRQMSRSLTYPRKSLKEASAPLVSELPGWVPGSITQGYYRGETKSYSLRIWADTATGIIYLEQGD